MPSFCRSIPREGGIVIFQCMTLIISIILVALAVFALCFNIIFKKDGKFPDGEISHSRPLRKEGIICAKEEELKLWGKNGKMKRGKKGSIQCSTTESDSGCGDCHSCSAGNGNI